MADSKPVALNEPQTISIKSVYLCAGLFAVAAMAALLVDLPVANFFFEIKPQLPGDVDKLINLFEAMGLGLGVAAIFLVILVLDPRTRLQMPRLVVCLYFPGLVVIGLKHLIGRARPNTYFDELTATNNFPDSAWDTFVSGSGHAFQSFPSGHTTIAVAAAVTLAWLYPRARWLFACYAALAATQRMYVGAHYLSDLFAAAAITCLLSGLCLDRRVLGGVFERIERRREK